MNIKRFNENVEEVEQIENVEGLGSDFESTIFRDVENDLENMDSDEAEDYLLSIITFCNKQLKNYK